MNEQTNKDNEPDGDLLVYQWLLFWLSQDLVSITSPYHTIDKKKISGSASTGCDKKKKTALQVHAQSLPIPTAAKNQ